MMKYWSSTSMIAIVFEMSLGGMTGTYDWFATRSNLALCRVVVVDC
jgi:hypothetical protein